MINLAAGPRSRTQTNGKERKSVTPPRQAIDATVSSSGVCRVRSDRCMIRVARVRSLQRFILGPERVLLERPKGERFVYVGFARLQLADTPTLRSLWSRLRRAVSFAAFCHTCSRTCLRHALRFRPVTNSAPLPPLRHFLQNFFEFFGQNHKIL